MADLPRPDVKVEHTKGDCGEAVKVTITRPGSDGEARGREHTGAGTNTEEAIKSVVEKIVGDDYTSEWLPERKRDGDVSLRPEPDRHLDLERPGVRARCSQWTPVAEEAPIEIRPLAEGGYELALYLRTLPNLGGLLLRVSGRPDYVQSRLVAEAVVDLLADLP